MQDQINKLIEWHKAFDVPFKETFDYEPLSKQLIELRRRIMREEIDEWASAAEGEFMKGDRAKELVDILYTVFGTIITEGLQDVIEKVFDAVHESNMSKLGDDGKPVKRADGKVLKGRNYKAPNLEFLYEDQQSNN